MARACMAVLVPVAAFAASLAFSVVPASGGVVPYILLHHDYPSTPEADARAAQDYLSLSLLGVGVFLAALVIGYSARALAVRFRARAGR